MCKRFYKFGLILISAGCGLIVSQLFNSVFLVLVLGIGAIVTGLCLLKKN